MHLEQARATIENLINRKISNNELSLALGMHKSNISRKLTSKTKLKLLQIRQLEQYFKITLDDIITSKNDENFENLKKVIVCIDSFLLEENIELLPEKKAELIIEIYKMLLNGTLTGVEKDNIIPFCRLIA